MAAEKKSKKKNQASESDVQARRIRFDRSARIIQAAARERAQVRRDIRLVEEQRREAARRVEPEVLLAEKRREWAEKKAAERQAGFVSAIVGTVQLPSHRPGDLIQGLSKLEILMTGDYQTMRDGERPNGFGPDGPSDKEIIGEIMKVAEVKRVRTARKQAAKAAASARATPKSSSRKSLRNLSRATPTGKSTPLSKKGTKPSSAHNSASSSPPGSSSSNSSSEEDTSFEESSDSADEELQQAAAAAVREEQQEHERQERRRQEKMSQPLPAEVALEA